MATELPRAPGQETQRREGPGLTRTGPGRTSHSAAVEEAAGAVLLAGAAVLLAAGRPRSGARTVRVWPPAG
jgi:hypothetical protein